MTDNVESLILEHLRHIRSKMDAVSLDMSDIKSRVSSLEETQGQLLGMMGGLGKRMDRSDERLGRIERRLDLENA
jgi:archaellum component FlaC